MEREGSRKIDHEGTKGVMIGLGRDWKRLYFLRKGFVQQRRLAITPTKMDTKMRRVCTFLTK